MLSGCGPGWCLAGQPLDLGPDSQLATVAAIDFDADGTVETNAAELAGLAGTGSAVAVSLKQGTNLVYLLVGKGYRNADGSFAR